MYNGEINIIYDIKGNYRDIRIFGDYFVRNNRDKCKMIIDDKEYGITTRYNVKNYNKNILIIKIKVINNITNISGMFNGCSSLSSLPDISKWNTDNVTNMSWMLYGCSLLSSLPDISKWNTNNAIYIFGIFSECSSLSISKWNTILKFDKML